MTQFVYRYSFGPKVALDEVETTLLLAIWAAESLHGASQVRLDATYYLDRNRRTCSVDAGSEVGRDLNRIFAGFLRREFGDESFTVERNEARIHQLLEAFA